ncbi:glycosyl transferase [Methylobacterium sp. Leaf104]|uniref:glycosyltransferase family 2 protein n=1 Tax=Methylobacterium TaxID=407 RepID=UPI000700D085|nr:MULTISPECIES: glycosyltransferase [Methylobacterium]KQP29864.1 glycosyl transferase [Methylobacterium sp. Leaf104]MCI9882447.1 glycosyltransferase family 2 protein [Methylobacterium goesingense]
MKLAVVIPTLGRNELLSRLLAHLAQQRRLPDAVVVSAVDPDGIDETQSYPFPVRFIYGPKGLCAQRNRALRTVVDTFDVVTFFDDDFIPADSYLEALLAAMAGNPDWVSVMGHVLYDGIGGPGLSFDDGLLRLASARDPAGMPMTVTLQTGSYGCNMSVRTKAVKGLAFDERLVLYGWQEDIDFTHQLWRKGKVVQIDTLEGVHLGHKSGRVSGLRFGYSQVINPLYLIRKGTMPALYGLRLILRNLVANVLKSVRPEAYIDRRGRLRGNLLGLWHAAVGRVEPEFILRL